MSRIIRRLKNFVENPKRTFYVVVNVINRRWPRFISDKLCLKAHFYLRFCYELNLKHPSTFSEKLQWLKLYDRRPEYTKMVDKYEAKKYAASIIGEEYIIPTLGVWDRAEDIEWDKLPGRFVLKCTHDSGDLIICKDKSLLDKENAIKKLNEGLKRDYYMVWREWPYKNVERRILAEELLEPKPGTNDIPDYKWYCFDGVPKFCQVIQNRSSKETIDFFDIDWNHQDFVGLNPMADNAEVTPPRPSNLDIHIKIARELSKGIAFSRIDLYEMGQKTYFGEITLYPASGLGFFRPDNYNEILGQMLKLPGQYRGQIIRRKGI